MGPSSTSTTSSPYAGLLAQRGLSLESLAQPLLTMLFGQMEEALRTGGIGAQMPIIQNAVSRSREAGNASMQNARNMLGSANLGNDPLSQGVLASLAGQLNQTTANIPTDLAMQFISMAPGFAENVASTGLNAGTQAAALDRTTTSSSGFDFGSLLNTIISAAGNSISYSVGGGAGGGGGGGP